MASTVPGRGRISLIRRQPLPWPLANRLDLSLELEHLVPISLHIDNSTLIVLVDPKQWAGLPATKDGEVQIALAVREGIAALGNDGGDLNKFSSAKDQLIFIRCNPCLDTVLAAKLLHRSRLPAWAWRQGAAVAEA